MTKAIRIHATGGPEVLQYEEVDVGEPGAGEARVRHSFIAVNFADIYFHRLLSAGAWKAPTWP